MKKKSGKTVSGISCKKLRESPRDTVSGQTSFAQYTVAAVIAFITLALYLPALKNGFVSWDDDLYVVENLHIRALNWDFYRWALLDYKTNLWHPLAWISHAVDYAVWGLDPFGHHLTSIILHAANTGIVVLLTISLLRCVQESGTSPGNQVLDERLVMIAGGVTGILFGIHPLHVESVAWIAERKDVLYSLFFMLSIMSYLRFVFDLEKTGSRAAHWSDKKYLYTILLFFLSLCSKPMAVTLPGVLLLLDWYPLKRIATRKDFAALVREKIPFIILSLTVSLVTIMAQKGAGGLVTFGDAPFVVRLTVAFKAYVHYVWKMIAPFNLLPFYPYPTGVTFVSPEYPASILMIFLVTAGCLFLARKHPLWLAVWAYFLITLFPVIGIAQAGRQFTADRFTYLPSLGFFILAGLGVALLWGKAETLRQKGLVQLLIMCIMLLPAATLSYATARQITIWRNELSLWNYAIEKGPRYYPWAYMHRGLAFQNEGKIADAISDFTMAIDQDPAYVEAHVNRGVALCRTGQFDRALADFDKAISLRPNEYLAYNNRGNAYYQKGALDLALADFDSAIGISPGRHLAYNNRGMVLVAQGENGKAVEDFTKAILLSPNYADAHYNRAVLYAKQGKFGPAIQDFDKTINLEPAWTQAYLDRGDCFRLSGNEARALQDYQSACTMGDKRGCRTK